MSGVNGAATSNSNGSDPTSNLPLRGRNYAKRSVIKFFSFMSYPYPRWYTYGGAPENPRLGGRGVRRSLCVTTSYALSVFIPTLISSAARDRECDPPESVRW